MRKLLILPALILSSTLLSACGSTTPPPATTTTTAKPSTYSISYTDTLYSTTCADAQMNFPAFNSSKAASVWGPQGQLLTSGVFDSGTDMRLTDSTDTEVDACVYSADMSGLPKHLGTYTFDDNGEGFAQGIAVRESDVRDDVAGISRGY